MENYITKNENSIMYALSLYGFWVGIAVLIFVCIHWLYFHRDQKDGLSLVVANLLLALGISVLSDWLYNFSISGFGPDHWREVPLLRVALKAFQQLSTTYLLISVIHSTYYYFRYMRK